MRKRIVGTIDRKILKNGVKLLNVDYTVIQLSEKLNLNPRYIKRALIGKRGAPHTRGPQEKILINGKLFYEWAVKYLQQQEKEKLHPALREDEFYCVKCRRRVVAYDIFEVSDDHNRFLKGTCPVCGTRVNKYRKCSDGKEKKEVR